MSKTIPSGVSAIMPFFTKNSAGQMVDADSLPTVVNVSINGVDADESSVTISQVQDNTPANITGYYQATADNSPTGLNTTYGDQVSVLVTATIGGVITNAVVCYTIADASSAPSIDVC